MGWKHPSLGRGAVGKAIPAIAQVILEVRLAEGRMLVHLLDGLLEKDSF